MEIPIGQLAAKVGASVDQMVRAIKIATFNGVIRDTRVDTGRLRGNWQTTTGSPANGELDRTDEGAALAEVQAGVTADQEDYLTNNLQYAAPWEEKDGMIQKNIARLDRNIREALR